MANNFPAVYGVNQYVWNQLSTGSNPVLAPADYSYGQADGNPLVPIIPLGEEPTFLQMIDEQPGIVTKPYIVYTWYTNGFDANSWYKPTDTVLYKVYAPSVAKLNQIVLTMVDMLKRYDVSAASVNRFIMLSNLSNEYKLYNYSAISVASATGGVAPMLEQDPITASVVLRVSYTNPTVDIPLP